jgi:RNA polymerase sigma factor (sigma-70 family)
VKETNDEHILDMLLEPKSYETGFRMLMVKYREPLYVHIRKMVGSHDDADDVLQNTFIKVFKNIDRFERKSKLFTWLYRIATNEAITYLSTRNKKGTDSIDDPDSVPLHVFDTSGGDIDGVAVEKKLESALQLLPEKQRAVFNLRYYDEMPYEEMSKLLDTSVGALKASYHHAVKKIEAALLISC